MIREANSEWSEYQHEKPVGIFASLLVGIVVDFVLEVMLAIVIVWEGGTVTTSIPSSLLA